MKTFIVAFICFLCAFLLGLYFMQIEMNHYFPTPDGLGAAPHPWIPSFVAIGGGVILVLPQLPFVFIGEILRTNTIFPLAPAMTRESVLPLYSVISAAFYSMFIFRASKEIKAERARAANRWP